jgi:alkylation response protein AidB-like acyl-CoA dehydrogenase
MFRHDSPGEAAFRQEVREWLEANLQQSLRGRSARPPPEELMPWYRKMSERGWIAPHWPKKYGGMGATLNQQIVLSEELARIGAPYVPTQGLNNIGPILIEFGTDAQRERHLPPIIRGDVIWAQGYSEPGAGSDLASLSTRAVVDNDRFIVNGQKTWQTWGHHADWLFTLVRTDPDAKPRHAGISFLLIDLRSPGVRVRPIRTIVGDDEFSEVFFDDVSVPMENLVGKHNDGWRLATTLLGHERLAVANPLHSLMMLERIKAIAQFSGIIDDAAFRDRLAGASISVVTLGALFSHAVALTNRERSLGAEASILKLWASELLQRLTDLLIEAAGAHALDVHAIQTPAGAIEVSAPFLQSRRATIYSGSSEIQRNVIARRVLNLPS